MLTLPKPRLIKGLYNFKNIKNLKELELNNLGSKEDKSPVSNEIAELINRKTNAEMRETFKKAIKGDKSVIKEICEQIGEWKEKFII